MSCSTTTTNHPTSCSTSSCNLYIACITMLLTKLIKPFLTHKQHSFGGSNSYFSSKHMHYNLGQPIIGFWRWYKTLYQISLRNWIPPQLHSGSIEFPPLSIHVLSFLITIVIEMYLYHKRIAHETLNGRFRFSCCYASKLKHTLPITQTFMSQNLKPCNHLAICFLPILV